MTKFAVLGDSISAGLGDPEGGGWPAFLASALGGAAIHNLSVLGALSPDVARDQLPAALELKPEVASVICGLNDTLRGGFSPARTGAALEEVIAGLRAAGTVVLTMGMPDPGAMLGLPGALSRPLARRMHAVNDVLGALASTYGTLHFDAAADPAAYERRNWSVDRLHPNERGHRLIAIRYHALLAGSGYPVGPAPDPEPVSPPPTRRAELAWMATKGVGWVLKRSTDLVPGLIYLALRDIATAHRES